MLFTSGTQNLPVLTWSGDPADGCCLCSRAPRSRIRIRDYPRSQADINGTGLKVHPVLGGLDRASRPIAPNLPAHSARATASLLHFLPCRQTVQSFSPARATASLLHFEVRPSSNRPPGLERSATPANGKLKSPGGLGYPLIRRGQGSARGDFQGENRGAMVQDVPSTRSR
jgi:hypothetical protein